MKNSKNMLLIISDDTNYDRGLLNFEIEKAVDYYKIPLIIAYTGYGAIWGVDDELENKWPKALKERISEGSAKCIHIPFKDSHWFETLLHKRNLYKLGVYKKIA